MKNTKVFEPAFEFPLPRGVEIVIRMLFFVTIVFFIDYIGLLKEPQINYSDKKQLIKLASMLATAFYAYKLMVNHTITNKVVIDYSERTFIVFYSFFYFVPKKREILFDDGLAPY